MAKDGVNWTSEELADADEDFQKGYLDYLKEGARLQTLVSKPESPVKKKRGRPKKQKPPKNDEEEADDEAPVTRKPRGRPKKRPPTDNEAGAPLDLDDEVTIGTRFTRYLSPQGRRGQRERKPVERFKPGK
jgi:hypothetical protein